MDRDNVTENYLKKVPEIQELQELYIAQCKENLIDDTDGAHVIGV